MRILSRQFLASYLTLYAGILIAGTLVVSVIDMMLNFDDALGVDPGSAGILSYLFLRVPTYYLPYLIPVTSFAAAFLCLGLPARAHEVVALKAGGIAPQRVCLPVLAAAVVISAGTLVLNETIVRDSWSEFNRREQDDEVGNLFLAAAEFWYERGGIFYNVQEADRASRTVYGVKVYERDAEGRLVRSIEADSATIADDHRWHLENATTRVFPADPGAAPQVSREQNAILDMASERELALLGADAATLDLMRLREYIGAVARDGRDPTRYQAMFHARLADPLTVLVFALLALPLGLAVERTRSLANAAVKSVGLLALYYALQTSSSIVASGGVSAAVLLPWALIGGFGAWGTWRLARVPA
ncbi:MAG: LptF/LptG family permease [Myxococcota bacterium]